MPLRDSIAPKTELVLRNFKLNMKTYNGLKFKWWVLTRSVLSRYAPSAPHAASGPAFGALDKFILLHLRLAPRQETS